MSWLQFIADPHPTAKDLQTVANQTFTYIENHVSTVFLSICNRPQPAIPERDMNGENVAVIGHFQ